MKTIILLVLSILLSGCTLYYRPVSEWEAKAMKEASFNVFPDDVRKDINAHKDSKIAWAGLIKSYEIDNSTVPPQIIFLLEHHYFSWRMDGTSRKFWLSPRGEGKFTAKWPFRKGWTEKLVRDTIKENDLMITYGTPKAITDKEYIDLEKAFYMRLFPRRAYRTDVLDYGRPDEPVKSLGLGLP